MGLGHGPRPLLWLGAAGSCGHVTLGLGHCLIPCPLCTLLWSRGDTKVLPFSFLFFSFSCSFFPFSPFRPKTWPQPLPHTRGGSPASNLCLHTPLCSCPLLVPPKPLHPAPRWAVTNPPAAHLTPPVMPSLPSHFCPSWPIFIHTIPFLSILTHFCSFWLNFPPPRAAGGSGSAAGDTSPGQLQGWGWHRAPTPGRGPRAPWEQRGWFGISAGAFYPPGNSQHVPDSVTPNTDLIWQQEAVIVTARSINTN